MCTSVKNLLSKEPDAKLALKQNSHSLQSHKISDSNTLGKTVKITNENLKRKRQKNNKLTWEEIRDRNAVNSKFYHNKNCKMYSDCSIRNKRKTDKKKVKTLCPVQQENKQKYMAEITEKLTCLIIPIDADLLKNKNNFAEAKSLMSKEKLPVSCPVELVSSLDENGNLIYRCPIKTNNCQKNKFYNEANLRTLTNHDDSQPLNNKQENDNNVVEIPAKFKQNHLKLNPHKLKYDIESKTDKNEPRFDIKQPSHSYSRDDINFEQRGSEINQNSKEIIPEYKTKTNVYKTISEPGKTDQESDYSDKFKSNLPQIKYGDKKLYQQRSEFDRSSFLFNKHKKLNQNEYKLVPPSSNVVQIGPGMIKCSCPLKGKTNIGKERIKCYCPKDNYIKLRKDEIQTNPVKHTCPKSREGNLELNNDDFHQLHADDYFQISYFCPVHQRYETVSLNKNEYNLNDEFLSNFLCPIKNKKDKLEKRNLFDRTLYICPIRNMCTLSKSDNSDLFLICPVKKEEDLKRKSRRRYRRYFKDENYLVCPVENENVLKRNVIRNRKFLSANRKMIGNDDYHNLKSSYRHLIKHRLGHKFANLSKYG